MRDYMVYFLTLMLSVCIFYMFNSVDAQMEMLDRAESFIAHLNIVIGVVSVFVSVVLAFLVIYANNYITRRRRKEIGLYMMLGFSPRRTAGLLVLETLLIGVLALAAGLGVGYLGAQGMSVLTAALFNIAIRNYHFIFSSAALIKTCIYFGIIFVVVMLFNVRAVSRTTLAKLLGVQGSAEGFRTRRRWAAIFFTAVGIVLIVLSYWMVLGLPMGAFTTVFGPALLTNFAGTFLVFYGLSGLMLTAGRKTRTHNLRGLRMFSERQLLSRVNTNAVSMTFIGTMIFLTLVIVSSVTSMNSLVNHQIEERVPFDISITAYDGETPPPPDAVTARLHDQQLDLGMFSEYLEYPVYNTDITQGILAQAPADLSEQARESFRNRTIDAVKVSDYNAVMQMQGQDAISLPDHQFALAAASETKDMITAVSGKTAVDLSGVSLTYWDGPIESASLWTTSHATGEIYFIIPDAAAAGLTSYLTVFCADYSVEQEIAEQVLNQHPKIQNGDEANIEGPMFLLATATAVRSDVAGTMAMMIFIGLYIGLIFLVAGAAILALQQLSGAADDRPRYELLGKLGASRHMIDTALLSQIAVYFFLPLGIGTVHSIFGITFMNRAMGAIGFTDVLTGSIITAAMILLIYGIYFAATYLQCRRIIHAKPVRQE